MEITKQIIMKILLAGAYMDFYVNKKKYNAYKTDRGRNRFVERTLKGYLDSLTGKVIEGITIRNANCTSNNFWGNVPLNPVNDLGYCAGNEVPMNEDVVTLRMFSLDIVGVVDEDKDLYDCFIQHYDKNFQFNISNVKLV
jgi:hypothetical protein